MSRPLKLPTNSARVRVENKFLWNEARSVQGADFYTIGYEGRPIETFISLLRDAKIKTLLDIRFNPVSMYRPEMSKKNLSRTIEDAGMHYLHIQEWGVPRDVRSEAINAGTRARIWRWYEEVVIEKFFDANLHRFLNLDHPVAMMCVESDPTECHRHRIFMALESKGLNGFDL